MIDYMKKDITTVNHGVIAHGVNCQGKMNAGVAKDIRNKWPKVFDIYQQTCYTNAHMKGSLLGQCDIVMVQDGNKGLEEQLYIANLYTQLFYGRDKKVYADLPSIDKSLQACLTFCEERHLPLFMPRIGCGLGGLSWEADVLPIVERHSTLVGISVIICDI